jgi:hypothetical protein
VSLNVITVDQGCQIFLGTIYQHGGKYTKLTQNITNGCKMVKMAVKYMYQHLPLQDPPKITQIAIFGLKIHHLATLQWIPSFSSNSICDQLESVQFSILQLLSKKVFIIFKIWSECVL